MARLALLLVALLASPAWADPLEGRWRTAPDAEGRIGLVEIAPCGAALCGRLTRAFDATGREIRTPDLGRLVIWDTVAEGGGVYRGRVYSPGQRAEYASRLTLRDDSLLVEGCMAGRCRGGEPWARLP